MTNTPEQQPHAPGACPVCGDEYARISRPRKLNALGQPIPETLDDLMATRTPLPLSVSEEACVEVMGWAIANERRSQYGNLPPLTLVKLKKDQSWKGLCMEAKAAYLALQACMGWK